MKAFTVKYTDQLFDAVWGPPQPTPVVRLAEADAVLKEAVWAMEMVREASLEDIGSDSEIYKHAQAFLASQVVAEWEKRQKGKRKAT